MAVPQKVEQDRTEPNYDTYLFPVISPAGHINGRYFSTDLSIVKQNKLFLPSVDHNLFLDETNALEALYGFDCLNTDSALYDNLKKYSLTKISLQDMEFPNRIFSTDVGDSYIPLKNAEDFL